MKGRHLKIAETELALPKRDMLAVEGIVVARLWDADGELKQLVEEHNIITEVGDEYYGERASGVTSPPDQVTGMRLGSGTTAASKTGAGAAIVTHITGSNAAITGGFPQSSLVAGKRRIQWKSSWAAGVATHSAITEAVITNLNPIGTGAGAAADTISRVVFSGVDIINKQAGDTLDITWSHDIGT